MKIIYKILNTALILALVPVLIFLPMFRFIAVIGTSSNSQLMSILGSVLDINSIISNATGIDVDNLPEFYTIKDIVNLVSGNSAKFDVSTFDTSVIPESITKFMSAAGILFIIGLVFALAALITGLVTKKKGVTACLALGGTAGIFAANMCFSHIASGIVSGKISLIPILSGLESIKQYQSYLSFISIDVRILQLNTAYTFSLIILVAVFALNIIWLLYEKSTSNS